MNSPAMNDLLDLEVLGYALVGQYWLTPVEPVREAHIPDVRGFLVSYIRTSFRSLGIIESKL